MTPIAIIGGSGLSDLPGFEVIERRQVATAFGAPSAALEFGRWAGRDVVLLARHGRPHALPPHRVNYRANVRALHDCGAHRVIALNSVGGITPAMSPERIVVPDQIVDYTSGRAYTFSDGAPAPVVHVDFTQPYDAGLRATLLGAARRLGIDAASQAVYGATQGPRLESAAEIRRMERDGCDIVGMTGMPETALARELGMAYACIAVVANRAAGKSQAELSVVQMEMTLHRALTQAARLLAAALPDL